LAIKAGSVESSKLAWLKWYLLGWGVLIAIVFFRDSLAEAESDFGLMLGALGGLLVVGLSLASLIRFIPWFWDLWRN
jgi:hypothetical protein